MKPSWADHNSLVKSCPCPLETASLYWYFGNSAMIVMSSTGVTHGCHTLCRAHATFKLHLLAAMQAGVPGAADDMQQHIIVSVSRLLLDKLSCSASMLLPDCGKVTFCSRLSCQITLIFFLFAASRAGDLQQSRSSIEKDFQSFGHSQYTLSSYQQQEIIWLLL